MRIHLKLTPNRELVPFDYQQSLVGAFHKWLGENELHDEISLYSLSWLEGGKMRKDKKGLAFKEGASFSISSPLKNLHKLAIEGIFKDQAIRWGMRVKEVIMQVTPDFGQKQRFLVKSPVLVKRSIPEEKHAQYFFPGDEKVDEYLTETMRNKLEKAGLDPMISIAFDPDYRGVKTKKIIFNKVDIRAAICPVIVEGNSRAVQFAWEVGVGNSTGIGFGALV